MAADSPLHIPGNESLVTHQSGRSASAAAQEGAIRSPSMRLVVISIASLYFELLLIRWLPTQIRVLAYFNNVILISCILGLGLGALLAGRRAVRPTLAPFCWLPSWLLAVMYHGLDVKLPLASGDYFLWNGLSRAAKGTMWQYVALFVFFAVNTVLHGADRPGPRSRVRPVAAAPGLPAQCGRCHGRSVGLRPFLPLQHPATVVVPVRPGPADSAPADGSTGRGRCGPGRRTGRRRQPAAGYILVPLLSDHHPPLAVRHARPRPRSERQRGLPPASVRPVGPVRLGR